MGRINNWKFLALTLLLVTNFSQAAQKDSKASKASKGAKVAHIMNVSGQCDNLVVYGQDTDTDFCEKKMITMTLENGRVFFTFFLSTQGYSSVISFVGSESNQFILGDKLKMEVDTVRMSEKAIKVKGFGYCSMQNPNEGKPVEIGCVAETKEGNFTVDFVTDGSPAK